MQMERRVVAGIYIERTSLTVVVASHQHLDIKHPIGPGLSVEAFDKYEFQNKSQSAAEAALRDAAKDIASAFPKVYSIAVACFGPFVSLMRKSPSYGKLHPNFGNEPLKGVNVHRLVREELIFSGLPKTIRVTAHTDANAFTVGEAIVGGNERNHVLVGVLATEGVGGGIVRGNSTYQSALHPELGLVMPRFDKDDWMKPTHGDRLFSRSIGELASNRAMRLRYAKEFGMIPKEVTGADLFSYADLVSNADLIRWRDTKPWGFRSYYLAQLCFLCAALLTPHQIVVASDLDPSGTLLDDIRINFRHLSNAREGDNQPLIDYKQFRDPPRFIRSISRYSDPKLRDNVPEIALTGAYGCCLLAARVSRGGPS